MAAATSVRIAAPGRYTSPIDQGYLATTPRFSGKVSEKCRNSAGCRMVATMFEQRMIQSKVFSFPV
jgi:hypothetical protein